MDPIAAFSDALAETPSSNVPDDVIAFQKKRMLDNLATAAAGRHATGLQALEDIFTDQGSAKQVPLAGHNGRASLLDGVYFNSVAARALDYCDVAFSGQHPSSTDAPVALGVGAHVGASGRDVLAALAFGQDIACRMHAAAQRPNAFHGFDGNVLSYFSACAVAGRLMGLSADEQRNAFGLVLNRAAGTFLSNRNGSLAVRFIQGFASRAGVESALLAQKGVTGPVDVLCGEAGFFDLYARRRDVDASAMIDGVGRTFLGGDALTCFKLYPSCSVTLSLTDAAFAVNAQAAFQANDIEQIELTISPAQEALCGAPFEPGDTPEAAALFSVRYVAANALVRKAARLEHFTPDCILDPAVLALAQSTTTSVEPSENFDQCRVTVRLKNGQSLSADGVNGKGWPSNPLTEQDVDEKLMHCFEFGGYKDFETRAASLKADIANLEQSPKVDHVMAHLTP